MLSTLGNILGHLDTSPPGVIPSRSRVVPWPRLRGEIFGEHRETPPPHLCPKRDAAERSWSVDRKSGPWFTEGSHSLVLFARAEEVAGSSLAKADLAPP